MYWSCACRQEELLRELDALHSSQELGVMELCHGVERAAERTQHACAFADRLLAHGSAAQVARVRRVVRARLLALINNAPRVDAGVRLEFRTDATRFRDAVARLFGSFVVPDDDDVDGGVKVSGLRRRPHELTSAVTFVCQGCCNLKCILTSLEMVLCQPCKWNALLCVTR